MLQGEFEMKHTPTPWKIDNKGDPSVENLVAEVRGVMIFGTYFASSCYADAAFIIRVVNTHAKLLEAAKDLIKNSCHHGKVIQIDSFDFEKFEQVIKNAEGEK